MSTRPQQSVPHLRVYGRILAYDVGASDIRGDMGEMWSEEFMHQPQGQIT